MKTFSELYNELVPSIQEVIRSYMSSRGLQNYIPDVLDCQTIQQLQDIFGQYNRQLQIDQQASRDQKEKEGSWVNKAWNTTTQVISKMVHTDTVPISEDRMQQVYFLVKCLKVLSASQERTIKERNELVQQVLSGCETLLTANAKQSVRLESETFELSPIENASHLTSRLAAQVSATVGYKNGATTCRSALGNMIMEHIFSEGIEGTKQAYQTAYTKVLEEQAGFNKILSEEEIQQRLHHLVDDENYELVTQVATLMAQYKADKDQSHLVEATSLLQRQETSTTQPRSGI